VRHKFTGWLAGLMGILSIAGAFLFSGTTAAFVLWAGFWAIPAILALYLMLTAVVFLIVPSGRMIGRRFGFDTRRFESGRWGKIFDAGRFIAVQLVNLALGPIVAALAIRFLGLSGSHAWLYASVTSLIAAVTMTLVYLGVGGLIMGLF